MKRKENALPPNLHEDMFQPLFFRGVNIGGFTRGALWQLEESVAKSTTNPGACGGVGNDIPNSWF